MIAERKLLSEGIRPDPLVSYLPHCRDRRCRSPLFVIRPSAEAPTHHHVIA